MKKIPKFVFVVAALVFLSATVVFAASVDPSVIPGAGNTDKTCAVVFPGTFELKLEGDPFPLSGDDGYLKVNIVKPSTLPGSPNSFDWTANYPVVGVIVKDGVDGANSYNYGSAGSTGDTYLITPNNGAKGISHISFCYYIKLGVEKTAYGSYDETHTWEIEKSVTPESQAGFAGDKLDWEWTVKVSEDSVDSNFAVSGKITITNPGKVGAEIDVTDVLDDGTQATVSCPSKIVPARGSLECTYSASPANALAKNNTATVTTTTPGYMGGSAQKEIEWKSNVINGTATVTDTEINLDQPLVAGEGPWEFKGPGSHTCSTDLDEDYGNDLTYDDTVSNTARVSYGETYAEDDASTRYSCYFWDISKTAEGSYNDQYKWDIEKKVTPASQSGFAGDKLEWEWSITWKSSFDEEINHAVIGEITVYNPAPMPLTVEVTDYLSGDLKAYVDCDGSGGTSLTVPANASGTCAYSAKPGSQLAQNTATATREGISVSYTMGIKWTKGADIGLDAVISDTTVGSIPLDSPQPYTYKGSHTCSTDRKDYNSETGTYSGKAENTATITWTGGSDISKAETGYACYIWDVSKTADATYDKKYEWEIEKTVDPVSQSGYPGKELKWTWSITWESIYVGEVNHEVTGVITVDNPAPMPLTVEVTDYLSGPFSAVVDCGSGSTSLTVPANDSGTCAYSAKPGSQLAQNTATATRKEVSVSYTMDIIWTKGVDIGLDAAISDTTYGTIPAGSTQPFKYTKSHTCSTDRKDYDSETGTYSGKAENTATITWTGGSDSSKAETEYLCKASFVDILKTTNGEPADPTKDILFALYSGTTQLSTVSTLGNGASLQFPTALVPGASYTICEYPVPAGYTFEITVDGGFVVTYAGPPGAVDPTGEIQCFDFKADDTGTTLLFKVENSYPGGAPRTPGYWKNWNTCTGGNQQYTAAALGGPAEGVYLLDDLLPQTVGKLVISDCQTGVYVLDARWSVGKSAGKQASNDAAYTLARAYLAALLNKGAGACRPTQTWDGKTWDQILNDAQALLVRVGYDGNDELLGPKSKSPDRATALYLYGIIDNYNNGGLCKGEPSH